MKMNPEYGKRPDRNPRNGNGRVMTILAIVIMAGLLAVLYLLHETAH